MKKSVEILKENNIKVTPQRLGVYNILLKGNRHYKAEEIYDKVTKEFPTISLGTVYSILEILKERGLVEEIRIDFQRSYFDVAKERHHHFQCKRCKKIYDVDMPHCEALKKGVVAGHKIEEFQGYFYGICSKCRNADQTRIIADI